MTRKDYIRLLALTRYLERWQKAHARWLKWTDREFNRRMRLYKAFRRTARGKLFDAIDQLKFKDGRVDTFTAAGDRAKWRFRRQCDQIFASVVLKGHALFGVTGKRDKAGVFVGDIDKSLKKAAIEALKQAFNES